MAAPVDRVPARRPLASWLDLYRGLFAQFGPQHWWPARSPFEVMVGAVLTQNTAWRNVERAIAALAAEDHLNPTAILALPEERLGELIRPAGYFRVKARRLQALCAFLDQEGVGEAPESLREIADLPTLRRALLGVHGVGEETADSILLYALGLPIFVVDAYTRRIGTRLSLLSGGESYGEIQRIIMDALPVDGATYNEFHALFVALGKEFCRPRPLCVSCPVREVCPHGRDAGLP